MKSFVREILVALFMGAIIPGAILSGLVIQMKPEVQETAKSVLPSTEPTERKTVSVEMQLRQTDGSVTEMDLDDYLVGVVLAEMPASFEPEALKAQAVVARTYTCRAIRTGGKHGDGSVCTQFSCCQAYISPGEYLQKGGTQESVDKIADAVFRTSGQVLTYEGALIEATYFSCSGGLTEDAAAVWGTDFPYLRSVESSGEEKATWHTDMVSFTSLEFQQALGVTLAGKPAQWFGAVSYTAGGGVDTMEIGGKAYRGTELRSLLGLRSTAFSIETDENSIHITTKGYGHRVGMSQYGADAMAVNGNSYEEILTYYYQGTELEMIGEGDLDFPE